MHAQPFPAGTSIRQSVPSVRLLRFQPGKELLQPRSQDGIGGLAQYVLEGEPVCHGLRLGRGCWDVGLHADVVPARSGHGVLGFVVRHADDEVLETRAGIAARPPPRPISPTMRARLIALKVVGDLFATREGVVTSEHEDGLARVVARTGKCLVGPGLHAIGGCSWTRSA